MKVVNSGGLLCEFSEDEVAKLHEIAERHGISLEEALDLAIKNFLTAGVPTPKKSKPDRAA